MRLERRAGPEQVGLTGKEPGLQLLCGGWTMAEAKLRQGGR